MIIPETLIEIRSYIGIGYQPLVDFGGWRVAILRAHDELQPENLATMQRHDETDEVFVLLAGRCILFVGDGAEEVGQLSSVDLEQLKLYNVKRGVWHTHTLSPDATVLIVENRDTAQDNSPHRTLEDGQRAALIAQAAALWR